MLTMMDKSSPRIRVEVVKIVRDRHLPAGPVDLLCFDKQTSLDPTRLQTYHRAKSPNTARTETLNHLLYDRV